MTHRQFVRRTVVIAGLLACLAPARAWAQAPTPPPVHDFTSCSIVGVSSGVSTASSQSGVMLGGMVGWPITTHFGVEADASWADRPYDGSAFAAAMSVRHNFTARQAVVPYARAGVGVYVARFDVSRSSMPDFYRRRAGATNSSVPGSFRTFTDPALVLATGVSWFVGRRIALRPEVEARVVFGDGHASTVMSVAARVEYHFEDYRITQDRTGR